MLTKMPKVFLFLIVSAATTVFAEPKFEIFYTGEGYYYDEPHGVVVGCTQKNADKYALKTVVIKDYNGNEKSLPVEICEELNKRGLPYHTIEAECSNMSCTWTGKEQWYDYDKNGNAIHYKDSEGREKWYDYDENGKITYYKDNEDYEIWHDYVKNGNKLVVHSKDNSGLEYWHDYDKAGRIVHYKNKIGGETWFDYVKKGNKLVVHSKDSDGRELWIDDDKIHKNPKRTHYLNGPSTWFE